MKAMLLAVLFIISTQVVAENKSHIIEVPLPTSHSIFYGSLEKEIKTLKAIMLDMATEKCGTFDNIALITKIKISLSMSTLSHESMDPTALFKGSYPLSGFTAEVSCR